MLTLLLDVLWWPMVLVMQWPVWLLIIAAVIVTAIIIRKRKKNKKNDPE